jgi:uncharacterized RmlC-like cupin family protein
MAQRADRILVVSPSDRQPGPQTPGMDRQEAFAIDHLWAGSVRLEAGAVSGWHHHGEHETVAYVLTGSVKFEFGPGGSESVEAEPGDFVYVPKRLVHRESNPSAGPADLIGIRVGRGESTFDVDGTAEG